jgi:hypothetical protein
MGGRRSPGFGMGRGSFFWRAGARGKPTAPQPYCGAFFVDSDATQEEAFGVPVTWSCNWPRIVRGLLFGAAVGCRCPFRHNCAASALSGCLTPLWGRGKSMKLMLVSALVMASVMTISAQYLAPDDSGLSLGRNGEVVIYAAAR